MWVREERDDFTLLRAAALHVVWVHLHHSLCGWHSLELCGAQLAWQGEVVLILILQIQVTNYIWVWGFLCLLWIQVNRGAGRKNNQLHSFRSQKIMKRLFPSSLFSLTVDDTKKVLWALISYQIQEMWNWSSYFIMWRVKKKLMVRYFIFLTSVFCEESFLTLESGLYYQWVSGMLY